MKVLFDSNYEGVVNLWIIEIYNINRKLIYLQEYHIQLRAKCEAYMALLKFYRNNPPAFYLQRILVTKITANLLTVRRILVLENIIITV